MDEKSFTENCTNKILFSFLVYSLSVILCKFLPRNGLIEVFIAVYVFSSLLFVFTLRRNLQRILSVSVYKTVYDELNSNSIGYKEYVESKEKGDEAIAVARDLKVLKIVK